MDAVLAWAGEQGCVGVDALALPGDRATKNFFETFGLVARAIVVHRDLHAGGARRERPARSASAPSPWTPTGCC